MSPRENEPHELAQELFIVAFFPLVVDIIVNEAFVHLNSNLQIPNESICIFDLGFEHYHGHSHNIFTVEGPDETEPVFALVHVVQAS